MCAKKKSLLLSASPNWRSRSSCTRALFSPTRRSSSCYLGEGVPIIYSLHSPGARLTRWVSYWGLRQLLALLLKGPQPQTRVHFGLKSLSQQQQQQWGLTAFRSHPESLIEYRYLNDGVRQTKREKQTQFLKRKWSGVRNWNHALRVNFL